VGHSKTSEQQAPGDGQRHEKTWSMTHAAVLGKCHAELQRKCVQGMGGKAGYVSVGKQQRPAKKLRDQRKEVIGGSG